MSITIEQLNELLKAKENENLEFKEAKNDFDFEKLTKYCAALANEGGGKIVLGVTDKHPRKVVESSAFPNLEHTKAGLVERLHIRIDAEELKHPDGRVVIFYVPSRPIGTPIQYRGTYWMRSGETLSPMTPDFLKRIFSESGPDFSAEICAKASMADLDPAAIRRFREMWLKKSKNATLETLSDEQLLHDAELIDNVGITYAALILFGTRKTLGKYLAQSEIIFEYRSSEASLSAQQRKEYREGFFLIEDDLWNTINLRNEVQQYREGLFMRDIPTFNETAVREAILNAVSHRDYRFAGSIFIRQFPRKLEIISPGGFPPGITEENILWKQAPRNRRLAEAFSKCGLVERSGQGMNRIFEECIKESKARPDFAGTDDYQVSFILKCEVQDVQFLRFLEQVGQERMKSFTTQDFIILDLIHREQPITGDLKSRLSSLLDLGVIEKTGRSKYLLSKGFYSFIGKKGVYTRKKGLDRETNKELLVKHIKDNQKEGSKLQDILQVLPACSRDEVLWMLRKLRSEGRIHKVGLTHKSRWFSGPASEGVYDNTLKTR